MKSIGYGVAGVLGILFIIMMMFNKPNEQKSEYMGEVIDNLNGNSTLRLSKMEPAFKQTLASEEEVVTVEVISKTGEILVVKDPKGVFYRISASKVKTGNDIKVGQEVQVAVKPKESKVITVKGVWNKGDTVTLRTNLEKLRPVGYSRYDETPIYDPKTPVSEVKKPEEFNGSKIDGSIVLVSNGIAHMVSHCNFDGRDTYGATRMRRHDKDGLYRVNEGEQKLEPIEVSAINEATCSGPTKYDSPYELLEAYPFVNNDLETLLANIVLGIFWLFVGIVPLAYIYEILGS